MFSIKGAVKLFGQSRVTDACKRRSRMFLRPSIESLEDRLALSWNLTGTWTGTLTDSLAGLFFTSASLNLQLNLQQSNNIVNGASEITGTALVTIPDQPQYFDNFNLSGSFNQMYESLTFSETSDNSQAVPPDSGFYWSKFSGHIGLSMAGSQLSGFWSDYTVGGLEGGATTVQGQAAELLPDIAVDSVVITSDGQNIDASYMITGTNLPAGPSGISFYWATGPSFADRIGISPQTVATGVNITQSPVTASIPIASLGKRPATASYILAVADSPDLVPGGAQVNPNGEIIESNETNNVAYVKVNFIQMPDIAMDSAALSSDAQSVNAAYTVSGSALTSAVTIDFYWASGPDTAHELGSAIKVPTATALGSYTVSTPLTTLGSSPANAAYIIAVADSPDADPNHYFAVVALAAPVLPDIVMDSATTTDARTVTASYDINYATVSQPLTFTVYRSASEISYSPSDEIASDTLSDTDKADLSVGHHQITITPFYASDMAPDPSHPFIVVVANGGDSIQERNYSNNLYYFQQFVLGIVTHGYVPSFEDNHGKTPEWELEMASSLEEIDKYDYVIPFNWVPESHIKRPLETVYQGYRMAAQTVAMINSYKAIHAGDVVALHFIGHSRGGVVIGNAINELENVFSSYIKGSYIRETMIDPHPAHNYHFNNNYMSGLLAGRVPVRNFQTVARDPLPMVPSSVNYAEVFFQNTPSTAFPRFTVESIINLWGHGDDNTIQNYSSHPIHFHDLTDQFFAGIGVIGHEETHEYYQDFVVNYGLSLSFS